MSENLKDFPINIELPILWGHMDAFQHVNNIMYFRFFESARIRYFEEIGFLKEREQEGVGPILASTGCKYISPLTYPDRIKIGAKTVSLEEDRFEMQYLIVSAQQKSVAATGEAKIVSYDYNNGKKVNLPNQIKESIIQIEKDLR
jgi:acyl-CoA thioester hydrolase